MGLRSFVLVVVLVFGVMFSALYYASSRLSSQQQTNIIPTVPKVSEQQAIQIAENDLKKHPIQGLARNCVCAVVPVFVDKYIPVSEFQSNKAHLPLEYYHPNGTFYEINSTSTYYTIMGKHSLNDDIKSGYYQQYNGKFGVYLELGKGRLYWILDGGDNNGIPFLYDIDAINGEILDSPYIRERTAYPNEAQNTTTTNTTAKAAVPSNTATTTSKSISEVIIPKNESLYPQGKIGFHPSVIKVVIGENNTVRWINQDITIASIEADDNNKDVGFYNLTKGFLIMAPEATFEYTFTRAGEYGYHSSHTGQHGTVIVVEDNVKRANK